MAAEQEHAEAQNDLAVRYERRDGVPYDKQESIKWMHRAAFNGSRTAQFNLGKKYRDGDGVPQDSAAAVLWLTRAAGSGAERDCMAAWVLGSMYFEGRGITQSLSLALKWYLECRGVLAEETFRIGMIYQRGLGIPKDMEEALKWYRQAARKQAGAAFWLATIYEVGLDVPADPAEAAKWHRVVAERGHPLDTNEWATSMGHVELGMPAAMVRALKEYRRRGAPDLMGGLRPDLRSLMSDRRLATVVRFFDSRLRLAVMHERGSGVPKNIEHALHWYRESAKYHDPDTQLRLGSLLLKLSTKPNRSRQDKSALLVESYQWSNIAAASGSPQASKLRGALEKRMTPEQIAEAQRLAREWVEARLRP